MNSNTKIGKKLATYAQCILLACSLAGLIYQFGVRPTFPDEPGGSGMALQMLPNVILVLALVCRFSLASWIGLFAAAVAIYWGLPDVSEHTFGSLLGFMIQVLWMITSAALVLDIFCDRAKTKSVMSFLARNVTALLLLSILSLMFVVPVAAVSLALGSIGSEADYIGEAPAADFDTRRAWGEKVLSKYLFAIDRFADDASMIRDDIGPVLKIAPIGSPNRTRSGFGDEFPASLNLQVIGENGSGVLNLPKVYIYGRFDESPRLNEDATWTTKGVTHLIDVSGEGYLSKLGVAESYASILQAAETEPATTIVHLCEDLDKMLETCGAEPRQMISPEFKKVPIANPDPESDVKHYRMERITEWTRQPLTFSELHPHYRIPLLKIYATALSQSDRSADAVRAWQDAADFEINSAETLLNVIDVRRDISQVEEQLRSANESLKLANQFDPKNKVTLRLARQRVLLSYLQSIDTSTRSHRYSYKDQLQHDAWGGKYLGLFVREAKNDAMCFPFLDRSVGARRVRFATGNLYVNRRNVYEASVRLEVAGRRVGGELTGSLRENDKHHVPVDLFADVPRPPGFPLLVSAYRWTPEGQSQEVRLDAATGEVAPKRKRKTKKTSG